MVTEKPILRGLFKISEGRLVWSGKWAMSSQKFKEGEKSKFKFIFTGDFGGDKVEAKDGVYKGYFLLKDASADGGYTKVPEKKVKLKFVKIDDAEMFEVEGTGSNKFGEFKLQGKYDPKSNKMALEKEYKQAEVCNGLTVILMLEPGNNCVLRMTKTKTESLMPTYMMKKKMSKSMTMVMILTRAKNWPS
mmetsp:Transcript_11726/g.15219  ORF Transcript_11726/g.15219 Transcript_11726/m.15219 type:complete len:190 (+) Transcript_11726:161-730(+)